VIPDALLASAWDVHVWSVARWRARYGDVPLPDRPVMTLRRAGALLKVHRDTLLRWLATGHLTDVRTPAGGRRLYTEEVAYITTHGSRASEWVDPRTIARRSGRELRFGPGGRL
jgi:excisionase family DNA binding protein